MTSRSKNRIRPVPPSRQPASQVVLSWRRRWSPVWMLLGLAALLAATWLLGGFSLWPVVQARNAIAARDAQSAEDWLALASRLNGDPAEQAMLEARLSLQQGELDAVERHLERATVLGADVNRVRRERLLAQAQAGRLDGIESRLEQWLANPGEDGAAICDAYTNALTIHGRLDEAQALLDAWQAGFPNDPKPHVKRGRIAEHALAYQDAEDEYRRALSKHPTYAPALYSLARLLLEQKRPEEALPLFQACTDAEPRTAPAALVGEAASLRALGRDAEARTLLERAVATTDAERQAAYARIGFRPEGDPAAFELGKLEAAARNYEAADKWLRISLAADPYDLDARYALAVALRGLGRQDEAQAEFDHVSRVRKELAQTEAWRTNLAEHPDDVESRFKIGQVYLQHQAPKLGLYWLQSVLAYDPNHHETHQVLADYYEAHQEEVPAYRELAARHRALAQHSSN